MSTQSIITMYWMLIIIHLINKRSWPFPRKWLTCTKNGINVLHLRGLLSSALVQGIIKLKCLINFWVNFWGHSLDPEISNRPSKIMFNLTSSLPKMLQSKKKNIELSGILHVPCIAKEIPCSCRTANFRDFHKHCDIRESFVFAIIPELPVLRR